MAWLTETPTNRSIPTFVVRLEGQLDRATLEAVLDDKLCPVERFRSRIESSPSRDNAWFVLQPQARSREHVLPVLAPLDTHARQREFVSQKLNDKLAVGPQLPQWEFWLGQEASGDTVLVGRVHHSLADGVALGTLMTSLADEAEALFDEMMAKALKQQTRAGRRHARSHPILRAIRRVVRALFALLMQLVSAPLVALKYVQVVGRTRPRALAGAVGETKSAAWSELASAFDVDDVKRVGKVLGGGATVNDVVMHCVMAGLRSLTDKESATALVPVNLRGLFAVLTNKVPKPRAPLAERVDGLQGNHIGTLTLTLPLRADEGDEPALRAMHRTMRWCKRSSESVFSYLTAALFGELPLSWQHALAARTLGNVDFCVSNVVGPDRQLHLLGHPIKQIVGFVPPPPGVPLGIVISSYAGKLQLSVAADQNVVGDAQPLLRAIEAHLQELIERANERQRTALVS